MTSLRIHLFGPFEVFRDEQPITNQDWRSQQTRAICKLLLARQGQVVTTDQIIDIFWPQESLETARKRLHVRISQLRSALGNGKSMLLTVDGGYIFSPWDDCWLDIVTFQTALTKGQNFFEVEQPLEAINIYEHARQLYRGEFLAEDLYTDWTFPLREFFRERFLSLLIELSECYAQQGRYRLAIARCQEALTRDPLREAIYVRLMLYHYFAGERSQSLRIFERCRRLLTAELGVDPLESTIKLAEQIRAGTLWASANAPRYPPPIYAGRLFEVPYVLSETPLVGRDREYAWLVDNWKNPDHRIILVEGIAGIGKTRLAETFAGYIAANGAQVLRARIAPGEHSPYAPLISALQPLLKLKNLNTLSLARLSALSGLFPEILGIVSDLPRLLELPASAERERLFDAVTALVAAGTVQPTLLFVDDAHRMGQAASEILMRLTSSLKILVSYRPEEISSNHPLYTIFRNQKTGLAILQLEHLTPNDVTTLIQQLAQNNLAEVGEEIIKQTSGHPLYLVTLLQHMFDEGQLYVGEGGSWGVVHDERPSLPPTIRETIEARLLSLDRSQRQILDLAAVIGGEFDFDLLQEASQQAEETLLTTLDRLVDLALIVEPRRSGQSEFMIAHDRYTEVAYDTLPKVRRKYLHHQVATAIESKYADHLMAYYPALTDHFGKAEVLDLERHYAILAGEQAAAQFENAAALHYLSRALELIEPAEINERLRLFLAREKVYDLLGDRQNQKSDLDEMNILVDKLSHSQQAEILYRTAAYDWVLGEIDSAYTYLEASLALAQSCEAAETKASSLLLIARCVIPDYDQAHAYLEAALAISQKNGLRVKQGDIVRNLGNICFWQNDYDPSRAYFEEALSIHREVGDLRGELSALNNLGHLSQLIGDPKSARNFFKNGLEICNKIGDRLAQGVILANLGGMLVELGEYDLAETHLRQACEIREEVKNDEGVGSLLPSLGDALRRQGKFTQAEVQLARSLEINIRIQHPDQQCSSLDGLSLLHRDLGCYASACDNFERALAILDDEQSPERVKALANSCLVYHLMQDNTTALEIGEKALHLSQELPQIQAIALKNLGHVLTSLGKYDEAQEKYQRALELHHKLMQPHLAPEPLAGLAQVALEMGTVDQALSNIEKILPYLETGPLMGPDQPGQIYLTCFQVLVVSRDQRAQEILNKAYNLLQQRRAVIKDEMLQQSYFENVIAHRKIIHLFQKQ